MELKYNNKSLSHHIKSATAWSALGYIAATLGTFSHIALLSRNVTPSELGVYFLFFSISVLLSTIAGLGLPEALIKIIAKSHRSGHAISRGFIQKASLISVVGCAGMLLFLLFFSEKVIFQFFSIKFEAMHFFLLCMWFILLSIQSILAAIFRANHDIKLSTFFANTLRNCLYFITTFVTILVVGEINLSHVLWCVVFSVLLNNIWALIRLKPRITLGQGEKLPKESILSLSIPLLGNLLIQLVIARVGIWALGYYSEKDVVGVYGAAVQMAALITMPLLVINSMAMPLIADMFHNQKNTDKLQSVLRTITTTISAPILLLYALIVLLGDELLALFFGQQFREGYWMLVLLATGQIGNLLAGPCGLVLKMTGFHKTLLYLNYVLGALAVVATFFAANLFGSIGVAFVAMMTFAAQNGVSLYLSSRKAGVNTAIFVKVSQWRSVFRKHSEIIKARISRAF